MINRNMPLPINSRRIYVAETHHLKVSGHFAGSKHITLKREKNCLR